jgi:lipoprotein-anchoring transpeptidase ErfK/SrfK
MPGARLAAEGIAGIAPAPGAWRAPNICRIRPAREARCAQLSGASPAFSVKAFHRSPDCEGLSLMHRRTALLGLVATVASPNIASAQLWRSLERIPEPTIEEPPPGMTTFETASAPTELPYQFRRQPVSYRTTEPPGTVVVNTSERFLYLVQTPTRAMRYGIGVGRDGFTWAGVLRVTRKAEWPDWTPPPEMIARQPYLPRWMAGGPGNPMGARALYLGQTVYRIHGTNAPHTIGHAVSSGCFRLVNNEIEDLYERVQVGAKVIVQH